MMHSRFRLSPVVCAILLFALPAAQGDDLRWIGQAEPPPRGGDVIRLATYNVENLFDDRDDPSLTGQFDDCWARDKSVRAKPIEHREGLAAAIRRLDADVIGLQEVESLDALVEFREAFLADMGYAHVMSIDVGQERGIEQSVQHAEPALNICIMGDFNATPDSTVMQMYREAGFVHAIERRDPEEPLTATHQSGRAIDFLLFCPAMAPEVMQGSGFVLATPVLPRGADWRNPDYPPGYASDHLPVSVDIVPVER